MIVLSFGLEEEDIIEHTNAKRQVDHYCNQGIDLKKLLSY
jgi:hypothetical protein